MTLNICHLILLALFGFCYNSLTITNFSYFIIDNSVDKYSWYLFDLYVLPKFHF